MCNILFIRNIDYIIVTAFGISIFGGHRKLKPIGLNSENIIKTTTIFHGTIVSVCDLYSHKGIMVENEVLPLLGQLIRYVI